MKWLTSDNEAAVFLEDGGCGIEEILRGELLVSDAGGQAGFKAELVSTADEVLPF